MGNERQVQKKPRIGAKTNKITYRNLNWTIYLSALLVAGVSLAFQKSWMEQKVSLTVILAAAGTGAVCQALQTAMEKSRWVSKIIPAAPLVAGILFGGASLIGGVRAYLSVFLIQLNKLYDTGLPVFSQMISGQEMTVFVVVTACALGELIWCLLYRRRLWAAGLLAAACILIQIVLKNVSLLSVGFLFSAILGICMVGKQPVMTALSGIWAVGASVVFCLMVTQLPVREIPAVSSLRQSAKDWMHEMRYGEQTLPKGDLHQTGRLQSSGEAMLTVTSEQAKDLYLKGYTAGRYDASAGRWSTLSNSDYAGESYGMFDWLKAQDFDPFTQSASYYELCDRADQPEKNLLIITVDGAQREQLYTPQSLLALSDTQAEAVEEQKDIRIRTRGVTGIYEYSMEELSDSRPSELLVAKDWTENPVTPEQKRYCEAEAVYRKFVYEHYTAVDAGQKQLLHSLFWDGYDSENDGIYSAVSRVREVLSKNMKYDETQADIPEGEEPVTYFLTRQKSGSSMLFASAAVLALREHGIPARYVEGYYISEERFLEKSGQDTVLTGKDQHAWIEVYFDGMGFLPVDVTPGFYYDSAALKKMVEQPGVETKKAAVTGNRRDLTTEQEQGQDTGQQEELTVHTPDNRLLWLGIAAALFLLVTVLFSVVELFSVLVPKLAKHRFEKLDERARVRELSFWIYELLGLLQIPATPGYRTKETGVLVAKRVKDAEESEYGRVCSLIEKSIYGGEELPAFEERVLYSFIKKLEAELENLPKRRRFAARRHCIKCCFARMKHRQ